MRLGALLYPRSRVLRQHSANLHVAMVVFNCSYLRKPWRMAMPTDNSRTYQATISIGKACAQCRLSHQAAKGSTLRMALCAPSSQVVHLLPYPWRSLIQQR